MINHVFILLFLCGLPFYTSFKPFSGIRKKLSRQFFLENRFTPLTDEKTLTIHHSSELFNKLNGTFYAQIGSNPKYISDYQSYAWLDGDGMYHAVFFNENNIVYQNKWVETLKLMTEKRFQKKMYLNIGGFNDFFGMAEFMWYSLRTFVKVIPFVKGTANTALFQSNNRLFALYEGDMPYELLLDNQNNNISTKSYFNIPNLFSVTAHPLVDRKRHLNYLFSYNNYDFMDGKFIFNVFDLDMTPICQKNVSLINNGIIHSVAKTENTLIIPDMPMKFDYFRMMVGKMPVYFDKTDGITRFGLMSLDNLEEPEWFYFKENFYVFHFAHAYETSDEVIIYACVNKNLDMENIMNYKKSPSSEEENSCLRELRINKKTKNTNIFYNQHLENINVSFPYFIDFPQVSKLNTNIIYASLFDASSAYIKGLIKIDTTNFTKSKPTIILFDTDEYASAESQVAVIENVEYIMMFMEKDNQTYISLVNMDTQNIETIHIPTRIPPGFHSIYN